MVPRLELLEFLRKHRLGVLATISNSGAPESALVGIAITDRLEVIFDTIESTRECRNLRVNPRVAFVIGWGQDETSVQYEGIADEPRSDELERVRDAYFAIHPDGRERLKWPGLIHFRVRPTWARYSDFLAAPEPKIVEFSERDLAEPIVRTITKDHLDLAPDPVKAVRGDRVTILQHESRPEWKGWIRCSLAGGKAGWISESYLDMDGARAVLNQDYDAREVEVRVGERIELLREDHGWTWIRRVDGREGWIPSQNY